VTTRRIWVISELYYPEETSTGHFLTGIAEGLSQQFHVNVLTSQPTYASRGLRSPASEIRNGVHIHRCFATSMDKDKLLFRLINLVTISLSIFLQALRRFRPHEIALVVTNPPLLPFFIALACRLRGTRLLLLVHDVYPDVLIATGIVRRDAFFTRLITWFTVHLYLSASRIIVLGRDMEQLVRAKLKNDAPPVVVIPNWGDVDQVIPTDRNANPLLKKFALEGKFVLQYSGNMGRTHGIEGIVAAARALMHADKYHFLFIGWGAKRRWLEKEVSVHELTNVTLSAYVPREQLSTSLNACDIGLISFVTGMSGISVPSRMYNVMAAGKPIIAVADPDSELALVVLEEDIGWVIAPDQPELLVDTILEAASRPERLAAMGARARMAAETRYSRQRVMDLYRSLIHDLTDE
jgi:colanic acid biosynthesis glycosyl transferase WcaI